MKSIAERRKYILDNIFQNGFVRVADLAEALSVTQTTIRKDLTYLEGQGLLYRAYGSALPTAAPVMDISLNTKRLIHLKQKQRIAARAIAMLQENDSIIMGAGSTVGVMAEIIKPKGRLNVVTPAVNIAMALGDMSGISVMQLGGILYGNSFCVIGSEAKGMLNNLHCSKLFFGVDGIDPDFGATCATIEEAELLHQMMGVVATSIVLADSSKIGFKGFGRICAMGEVDVLITDSGISDSARKAIEKTGVRVITV
jgi:DeoR family transcriptional regulator of aga operon